MKQAVFVSRDNAQFKGLEPMLGQHSIEIKWCATGKELLSLMTNTPKGQWIDLVIMEETLPDMNAKALVEAVTTQSPMTNCAITGTMDKKEFHDVYEGYGVLMQLSVQPGEDDAKNLEDQLKKIRLLG
ncbi:response regulator [Desulfobacter curvatus]|uniref:response regulator n=1 Tax=Desulfobacter curvatus TaxID=2290 RepID=UPI0003790638|nr:response regulator [Desulfobacter curvatus]